jgi:YfiH family protein
MIVLRPDWAAPAKVGALVTTRAGGRSEGCFAGLNLAEHVGDDPAHVATNRHELQSQLPAAPHWLSQVHGTRCVAAESAASDCEADASVAHTQGHVCAVLTADCLPVLLCDRAGGAVGVAHAGWRGLAAGVIEATVAAMARPPAELMAWLGPAIGPEAFEVGSEVRKVFVTSDPAAASAFKTHGDGKWLCDLYALARLRLAACGVGAVSGGGYCTYRERERFYSYRRDGRTGRMASLIWIEAER